MSHDAPSEVAPSRIAVLRSFALGDLLMGLPALASLRAAHPHAHVVLMCGGAVAGFAATHVPAVDEAIGAPPGVRLDGEDDAADVARFAREVADRGPYDLAIQLFGGGRWSNPFLRSIGARRTVGPATPDAEPLDVTLPFAYFHWEVARALEIVACVGGPPVSLEPAVPVLPSDLDASLEVVPEDGRPLAVIHPGASDPRRRWPAERFAAVGDAIRNFGGRVVVTGTPPERPLVDEVAGGIDGAIGVTDLTLEALTGLLRRAGVVVGNDTGPLHLAAAVGTRSVAVYWCGNLINAGPFGRRTTWPVVSWSTACPRCGADVVGDRCGHTSSIVADAPLDEVRAAAIHALEADADTTGGAQATTRGASTSRDGIVVGSSWW